jgi:hypothetical protein
MYQGFHIFTAIAINSAIFRVREPYILAKVTEVLEEHAASIFRMDE